MSLPSSVGYDTNIVPAPEGDVENFTFIKDGSDFSPEFLADINTGDGSRARFAWDIDGGEMAFDWIADDVQVDPGVIRIGAGRIVYAASSDAARLVRSYAPNTRNTAYAATDTYGQYNAYDSSWLGYWPLISDGNDRTANQNNGVAQGGLAYGGGTGVIGKSTVFDGADDYVSITPPFSAGDTDFQIGLCYKGTDSDAVLFGQGNSLSSSPRMMLYTQGSYYNILSSGIIQTANSPILDSGWHSLYGANDSLGYDGSEVASGTVAVSTGTYDSAGIGTFNRGGALYQPTIGEIQHVSAHALSRGDDYRTYDYAQTSDNSTFWDTATWVPGDTGLTIDAETGALSLTGKSADILVASKLDLSNGSFVLTGYDADLTKAKILNANQASLLLSGNDADLLQDLILNAGSGTLSFSGQDSDLEKAPTVFAESGALSLSGQDADLLADKKIEASHGTLSFSGSDIDTFLSKVIGAGSGLLTFTGMDADLMRSGLLSANTGIISLSGKDATINILAAGKIEAETGYFSLSGASIDIDKNTFIDSESGSLSLSGKSADFIFDKIFDAETGVLSLSGLPAEVVSGLRRFFALKTNIIFDIDGEVTLKNNIQFDIDDGKALKANVIFDIEEDG